ncbi:MAG: hypothetical protein NVS4B3_17530 [Gemmatimonadaceae bacterium]
MEPSEIPLLIAGTPSGWYVDPTGRKKARYWDGATWTDKARDDVSGREPPAAEELRQARDAAVAETRWRRVAVTTSHELPNSRIVRHVAEVMGITVRTRNMFSNAIAGVRGAVGGEVGSYTKLMVLARHEALDRLRQEADGLGANAVIATRISANQISSEMTEFVAYGAAVVIEAIANPRTQATPPTPYT